MDPNVFKKRMTVATHRIIARDQTPTVGLLYSPVGSGWVSSFSSQLTRDFCLATEYWASVLSNRTRTAARKENQLRISSSLNRS